MGENNSGNVDVKVQAVQAVQVQGHPQIHLVSADHVHMLAAAAAMSMPGQMDGGQGGGGMAEQMPVQVVDAQPIDPRALHASARGGDGGGAGRWRERWHGRGRLSGAATGCGSGPEPDGEPAHPLFPG